MTSIIISTNSDLDSVTYATDTDAEVQIARQALRDAGLAYEDEWVGEGDDAVKNGNKLFA